MTGLRGRLWHLCLGRCRRRRLYLRRGDTFHRRLSGTCRRTELHCALLLGVFAPDEQAFEGAEPFCQRVFVGRAEAEVLLFGDDLHAVLLAAGHGVNVDGVDDAREGDYVGCGVLFVGLVKGKSLGSQDYPDLLPLAHAAF
jgi:hypothetical protein